VLIRARLRRERSDRRLARGVSPDTSVELSIRARALLSARARRRLARNWRRLIEVAETPPHAFDARVRMARAAIRRAAELIEELAEQLESGEPVDAAGIAQARLLLIEPGGPVYCPNTFDLELALDRVLETLAGEPLIEDASLTE
jgi:hypothetical protein